MKQTTHQVYNPNTKLLNINNGQKVKDVSTGKVYGPKNGLTAQQQAGRASLRAGTPVPQQVKSPTTHQVYKNGVLTVTPTQASKAFTPEGQLAAKEGIFTNPTTGIQTDKSGNVVTGKNEYGVLQTTGTTAPSAMGTTTQGTVTPTVPTATTPVVDIGGGGTTTGATGTAEATGTATDQQRLADIAWKQHIGQPFSEEDFKYLVGQQLSGASSVAAQTQAAATAQETAAQDLIAKKQAEMEARASSQSKTTQGLVDQQKALLDEQAKAAIDQIKQNAMSEQTAGQNIMAFSGFGVSSAAIQKTQEIQAKYNAQSQAVVDAENLQMQQYQAQLQGADQAVLDEMQANIDTLQANADEMAYSNALDVAQANADANVDPLTALSNIMQVLPPAQAQQVNTDVSKMLGYLADESGNPITFANGETIPILTETTEAKNTRYLDELVKSGASPEIINALKVQLGLPDYTDPITQAQLAYDQANAKVKENEANGVLTSPLDMIDLAQKQWDLWEAQGYNPSMVPEGGGSSETTASPYGTGIRFGFEDGSKISSGERPLTQCGQFVNDVMGLSMGDSYASKMSYVDKSIQVPTAGMAFVMPVTGDYAANGHTGIVEGYDPTTGMVSVADVNSDGKGTAKHHDIPLNQILNGGGFVPAPQKSMPADAAITLEAVDKDLRSAVTTKANQFDAEPLVRNFQTIQEGKNYLDSLDPNSLTSSDNQSIIYAFAKIMDPNSVVRESEYETVQRYAQSLASTYGFNAERLLSNTEFLTPEAVQNMIKTVQSRYDASKQSYDQFRNEYVRSINNLAGGVNIGNSILQNYITPTNTSGQEDLGTLYDQYSDYSVSQNDLWDSLPTQ